MRHTIGSNNCPTDYSGAHNNDPDWAERPNFFDHNCPDGMRAQVFFPSCWDGVNLDSADHKSHMAYPIQNFNSGDCPASHPVQLISLFYEMFVNVGDFPYNGAGTWVLANGDTTGYGHHGDFQNGWDVDLLQTAIDTCVNANGNVMDCPALAAVYDHAASDACVIEEDVVEERLAAKLHDARDELRLRIRVQYTKEHVAPRHPYVVAVEAELEESSGC